MADKTPMVEANFGWIENYLDPERQRGYFEGFAAIRDGPITEKYEQLAKKSKKLIENLPWPKEMKVEEFTLPEFSALHIVSLASHGVCMGKNLPNYERVKANHGFKNHYFINSVAPVNPCSTVDFLSKDDADRYLKLCSKT